jgi:hypothetical protein
MFKPNPSSNDLFAAVEALQITLNAHILLLTKDRYILSASPFSTSWYMPRWWRRIGRRAGIVSRLHADIAVLEAMARKAYAFEAELKAMKEEREKESLVKEEQRRKLNPDDDYSPPSLSEG